MIFIAKLTFVLSVVFFLCFSGLFILYIRDYVKLTREMAAEKGFMVTMIGYQREALVTSFAKPLGFTFVWFLILAVVSLLSWLVA